MLAAFVAIVLVFAVAFHFYRESMNAQAQTLDKYNRRRSSSTVSKSKVTTRTILQRAKFRSGGGRSGGYSDDDEDDNLLTIKYARNRRLSPINERSPYGIEGVPRVSLPAASRENQQSSYTPYVNRRRASVMAATMDR